MQRRTTSCLKIKGTLVALSPLHVGGMGGNADVDMALAKNGAGQWYVPGTSLAGPVRAWLRAYVGEERVRQLWGHQEHPRDNKEVKSLARRRDETKSDDVLGWASFVILEDGIVNLPQNGQIEIRDGVGINRITGAAASGVKYDRAVLPTGTVIGLEMTVERPSDRAAADDANILTGAILKALQEEKIRFGAARSRGLGRVRLEAISIQEEDFSSTEAVIKTLQGQRQQLDLEDLGECLGQEPPVVKVQIAWQPHGPVMVKAECDGIAVDMLPLVSARNGKLAFVLPGSSIKGALRNQAERIVRTLIPSINTPVEGKNVFLKQIEINEVEDEDEEYRRSLIGALFGSAGKASESADPDDQENSPLLGASAITIEDCYARNEFSRAQWEQIERAKEIGPVNNQGSLLSALSKAGLQTVQPAFHVAIDRWTGGAAEGALYTVLEPHGIAWNQIELSLDLTRLRTDEQHAAIACLLFVLRDFVAGRIPLGFGTNRGMGAIQVTKIKLIPQGLDQSDILNQLKDLRIENDKLIWPDTELRQTLNQAWTEWIAFARKGHQ